MKQQAREDNIDPNVVVQLRGLFKTYPKKIKLSCRSCCFCCYCCVCKTRKAYTAVKVSFVLSLAQLGFETKLG